MTPRERVEAIIEALIDVLDRADGDIDLEAEHHDGEPLFPGHPCYVIRLADRGDGPGDPQDAETDDPDEDADADEWSGVIVYDQRGRWRCA